MSSCRKTESLPWRIITVHFSNWAEGKQFQNLSPPSLPPPHASCASFPSATSGCEWDKTHPTISFSRPKCLQAFNGLEFKLKLEIIVWSSSPDEWSWQKWDPDVRAWSAPSPHCTGLILDGHAAIFAINFRHIALSRKCLFGSIRPSEWPEKRCKQVPKLLFTELTAWVLAVETKLFYPFFYPHSEFLKRTLCDPATEPIFPWFLEIVTNDDLVAFPCVCGDRARKALGSHLVFSERGSSAPSWYLAGGCAPIQLLLFAWWSILF